MAPVNMINPDDLKSFLNSMVKDQSLKMQKDGTTFCNVGVNKSSVALFGCHDFEKTEDGETVPMTAREIIQYVKYHKDDWLIVSGSQASDYAIRGGNAISFMEILIIDPNTKIPTGQRALHDHVARVYPGEMQDSESLKCLVPMVANIGKENRIMKSSEAYPVIQGECSYAIRVG